MADTPDDSVVQLTDPSGNLTSVSPKDAEGLRQIGYREPSAEQLAEQAKHDKFGTTGQQILTGLEGAGEGATFGLSTGLEKAFGVDPANIRARREENPASHMAGQVVGIGGSSLLIPGGGAAGILEGAGAGGAEIAGLGAEAAGIRAAEEAAQTAAGIGLDAKATAAAVNQARQAAMVPFSVAQKIGSKAVKFGIENMLVSGGDEVSKYLSNDPNQADAGVGMAMANIGLSGLLGAGTGAAVGAVSPLWQVATKGRLGGVLGAIRDKVGGVEGAVPESLTQALTDSGMEVQPEIKAGLSEVPEIQKIVKDLDQSDSTGSGQAFQKSMQDLRSQSADTLVRSLGKTPEEVNALGVLSKAEEGTKIQDALASDIKQRYAPIADDFNNTSNRFKDVALDPQVKANVAEKLAQLGQSEGWSKSPSSPEFKLLNNAIEELPLQQNLDDLQKYQSRIGSAANANGYNQQLARAGQLIKGVLRDTHADLLEEKLGAESPELLERFRLNNQAYKAHAQVLDQLNDSLHLGKVRGTASFLAALKDQPPETFLSRIGNEKNAGLIELLQKEHPSVANALREYKVNNLLRDASFRAPEGHSINSHTLLKSLNEKMSPEYRKFLVPEESEAKIAAIDKILSHFNSMPHNFSNTARTVDRLWSSLPGSALGLATMVAGHNPAIGFLVGAMTKLVGRDAPDAIKLGLLKFLGSSEAVDSEGFKTAIDYISHTIKGDTLAAKAIKGVFKAGAQVIPESISDRQIEKLDKKLKHLHADSSPLLNTGGSLAHYMPTHGMMMAQTAANSVNYLNSLRPQVAKNAPLDEEMPEIPGQKQKYYDALRIAEQPLSILNNLKDGSLTTDDMAHLNNLYPGLKSQLTQKLLGGLVDAQTSGTPIPYHLKLGLSLFMGEPMDSTMTPQGIMAAQPKPQGAPAPPQGQKQASHGSGAHSMKNIGKLATSEQTPSQARVAAKIAQA